MKNAEKIRKNWKMKKSITSQKNLEDTQADEENLVKTCKAMTNQHNKLKKMQAEPTGPMQRFRSTDSIACPKGRQQILRSWEGATQD